MTRMGHTQFLPLGVTAIAAAHSRRSRNPRLDLIRLLDSDAVDNVFESTIVTAEFTIRRDPNEVVEHAIGPQDGHNPIAFAAAGR